MFNKKLAILTLVIVASISTAFCDAQHTSSAHASFHKWMMRQQHKY